MKPDPLPVSGSADNCTTIRGEIKDLDRKALYIYGLFRPLPGGHGTQLMSNPPSAVMLRRRLFASLRRTLRLLIDCEAQEGTTHEQK